MSDEEQENRNNEKSRKAKESRDRKNVRMQYLQQFGENVEEKIIALRNELSEVILRYLEHLIVFQKCYQRYFNKKKSSDAEKI